MSKRSIFSLLVLLLVLAASVRGISAQVTTVTISGTVSDTAGAVIPNAQVTAINTEATNALNIVNLNNPVTGRSSNQFGQVRDARTMRETQLGLRLTF
ncbi:MAG: carboxypeptidase-like regulatory domain-containing protein [Blastocatellia bacterium]